MGKSRKRYEVQFKKNIVKQYEEGASVADLVIKYGLSKSNIVRWINEYSKKITIVDNNNEKNYSQNDIKELEKEIADLKESNEILKKAITIFAK